MRRFWWSALYLAAVSLLSNLAAAFVPRDFHPDRFPFRSYTFEGQGRFYEKLGIRKWKDRVPDMSKFLPSLPRKAVNSRSADRARLLVQETCLAELVHLCLMALALPVLFIWPGWKGAVLAAVYALGNVPFIMIQRYNRPRLLRLAEKLERVKERALEHV